ncbi:unnamed protein product [Rotaria sordida]|uniref:Uncharacterized protein n=1 Tax=Rotaria sordida TaxID=392033 RepID=A0A814KJ94_9BILA|nr:unnamed protein product [Rotaria sordida]CAF4235694.1 unnamed protein product [Rotaria sordida]
MSILQIAFDREQNKYMIVLQSSNVDFALFNLLFNYGIFSSQIQIDSKSHFNNIRNYADVKVTQDKANITRTTISTDHLSSCYCFLLNFHFGGRPYSYLNHHAKFLNLKISAPNLLAILLGNIVIDIKRILSGKQLSVVRTINIIQLKHLKLFICGGVCQDNDVIRNAFSLLLDPDESTSSLISNLFDKESKYLFDNLSNNTIIINPITYLQTSAELQQARGELIDKIQVDYVILNSFM